MNILKDKSTFLFLILAGFFVANAIVAEMIGGKIFSLESTLGLSAMNLNILGETGLGFNLTAGVLLWPFVFLMTDLINEYYGKKAVRFLSYLTAGLIVYAFIMVYAAIHTSPNNWWALESGKLSGNPVDNMDIAFGKVMGQGLWIIIGSLVAFLIGQIIDVYVFQKIKSRTGENQIWLRATGSTLISQLIDSFIVLFIAFYIGSDWSFGRVLAIGLVNYFYKFLMALIITPILYLVHNWIDGYLGQEMATKMKDEAMALS